MKMRTLVPTELLGASQTFALPLFALCPKAAESNPQMFLVKMSLGSKLQSNRSRIRRSKELA